MTGRTSAGNSLSGSGVMRAIGHLRLRTRSPALPARPRNITRSSR